jgi:hypothetical protein
MNTMYDRACRRDPDAPRPAPWHRIVPLFAALAWAVAAGLTGHADEQSAPGQKAAGGQTGGGQAGAAVPAADPNDKDDLARKAEIMNSPRWRRAIFELGEWLSSQAIYTPAQVNQIKVDFNRRVAKMSSYELEYLLDDLDAKFKVIDTPEAREVRAWVGQYLSVLSDQKRADVLRDVPNVVTMSAGQLQQEIVTLEQRRAAGQQRQADFARGRDLMVQLAGDSRKETAKASAAAMAEARASFSPYRSGGSGEAPFSNAQTGATTRGIFGGMGFGFGFGIL